MLRPASVLLLGALTLTTASASAHIRLNDPAPRFSPSGIDQKAPMCGAGTPTGDVTWYQPGETITVQWDETIDHPGHFRISVDSDGGDDDLVDPTSYTDFDVAPSVLLDNIPDNGGSTFSAMVTLPNVECEKCTLQVIQVMTDKPPFSLPGNDIYYWCADIRISTTPPMTTVTTGAGTGGGGTTGSTTTTGGVTSGSGGAAGSGGGGTGGGDGGESDGCGCTTSGATGSPFAVAGCLAAIAALRARRRRHSARTRPTDA